MVALFVILSFALFIGIDILVLRAQRKKHPALVKGLELYNLPVFGRKNLLVPAGIMLTKGHNWIEKVSTGVYRIGIDEFITRAFGAIQIQFLKQEGDSVQKGEVIMVGKTGNKSINITAPFSGTIRKLNSDLHERPVADVFGNDWAFVLNSDEAIEKEVIPQQQLATWIKDEFVRLKDFITGQMQEPAYAGVTMQDGGHIVEGAVAHLSDESVNAFEQQFLKH